MQTRDVITPFDNLIMAMESLESLQAYLQGHMNLGGTTTAGRPLVQARFTAMDDTVNDIHSVYTTLPSCKPADIDDALLLTCAVVTSAQPRLTTSKTRPSAAAAGPKTELSPLKAKLDAAKVGLQQAVTGFGSSGVCAKGWEAWRGGR